MRILHRKALRDLWQIRWRSLTVTLTVAAGVGIYAGIGMAIESGFNGRDVLFERMRFADLEVQFLPEDVANLPDLTRIPGVQRVERRLVLPGTVFLADGRRMTGVLAFLDHAEPTIDKLEILEGSPIRAGDFESAVIDRALATFHGFKVGDRIRVQVGEKIYESRIDGVATSPEYLISTANPDYFVPEKGAIGGVFTNLARVSDALGFVMVNDLLVRFEPGADRRAVTEAVVQRLARLNIERVIPREQHFIWKYVQLVMEAFQVYAPSIVVTLGTLAFVLTLITVNRLVLDQRREIGVILALGYRRRQVLLAYVSAGVLLGTAGGAIGIGLAFVFRKLFMESYSAAIGWPELFPVVLPALLVIGFAAAMVGTAAATALPVWRMLRLPPQAIIREPVGEAIRFGAWAGSPLAAMAALPLPVRFGVRNMIRRPGRAVSTFLAIGLSLSVAIAYMVSLRSTLLTIELVFARESWDLAVDFLHPVHLDDLQSIRSLPGVAEVEPYFRRFAEVRVGERSEPARILGIQPNSRMKRPLMRAGGVPTSETDELALGQDLARRLGVSVGDKVTIKIRQGREFAFRVVGISGESVPGQVIMPFGRAQAITEFEETATGMHVVAPGKDPQLISALAKLEYAAKVTTKGGVAAALRKLMSDMLGVVYVASGVSVAIAALFIFMSVNFVISERQAEYAILKCLGYGRGRLAAVILAQALGEGVVGALVSVPVGISLAVFLNARLSRAWYEVITIVRPEDVAQILALSFVLIPFSVLPGLRMLERLNVVRALGARTLE